MVLRADGRDVGVQLVGAADRLTQDRFDLQRQLVLEVDEHRRSIRAHGTRVGEHLIDHSVDVDRTAVGIAGRTRFDDERPGQGSQAGISDESSLNLYYWDAGNGEWIGLLPCAGCSLDTNANRLTIQFEHTGDFALFGEINYPIYLPLVSR